MAGPRAGGVCIASLDSVIVGPSIKKSEISNAGTFWTGENLEARGKTVGKQRLKKKEGVGQRGTRIHLDGCLMRQVTTLGGESPGGGMECRSGQKCRGRIIIVSVSHW